MVNAYYRPKNLTEALEILSRKDGDYRPMGGGVVLSQDKSRPFSIVDLQALGLNSLTREGQFLQIGAVATLQSIEDFAGLQPGLKTAIGLEANFNLRQQASAAGAILSADGRSTYAVAMMALDATLHWLPDGTEQAIGDWFTLRSKPGGELLVDRLQIPLNATLAFESVGKTPLDLPVICAAIAHWPSGRIRITLGGFGPTPILALDAPEPGGVEAAVHDALARSDDQWASAAYRQDTGGKLVSRILTNE